MFALFVSEGENVLKAADHVGVFEQIGVVVLAEQVADGGVEQSGQLFGVVDGGRHLATLVAGDHGNGGTELGGQFRLRKLLLFA